MKLHNKKVAFSLIELLVVITIMWILAVWGTTVYNSQIQKARDSNRITDVTYLQSAIEQFYQDKASYPSSIKDFISTEGYSIKTIIQNFPEDPLGFTEIDWCKFWYYYEVWPSKSWIINGAYRISTCLENSSTITSTDWGIDNKRFEIWLSIKDIKSTNWFYINKNWVITKDDINWK